MQVTSLLVSILAFFVAGLAVELQRRASRAANNLPVLIDLFKEHREKQLATARRYVYTELAGRELSVGLDAIPSDMQDMVRDLCWFYDNLGALVAHGIIDLDPVCGYMGGSIIEVWNVLRPMILAERQRRGSFSDPNRWQEYFENLDQLVIERNPDTARRNARAWRLAY